MDRRVLLRLKAIDALQRKESAQAVYLHRKPASEPGANLNETYAGPVEPHLKRVHAEPYRSQSNGAVAKYRVSGLHRIQTRTGNLQRVHYRNPKLISSTVKSPRKEVEEQSPEQNYDEVIKALKAAGIDPQKAGRSAHQY
jgi:hypothetical protein